MKYTLPAEEFFDRHAYELFHDCGLCSSRNEARRLAKQGGLRIDDLRITEGTGLTHHLLKGPDWPAFAKATLVLWRGKKRACVVNLDFTNYILAVIVP